MKKSGIPEDAGWAFGSLAFDRKLEAKLRELAPESEWELVRSEGKYRIWRRSGMEEVAAAPLKRADHAWRAWMILFVLFGASLVWFWKWGKHKRA